METKCDKIYLKRETIANEAGECLKKLPPKNYGTEFSDHMLKMEYDERNNEWKPARITKLENISLHPAAKVFQYCQTVFEGMKAYRGVDNKLRFFRPLLNLERLNRSAERAMLPKVNTHDLLKSLEKLIRTDEKFVPLEKDGSLYVRPVMMGTEPNLSTDSSSRALLYVILSPVKSFLGDETTPIRLYANPNYVRAWKGGAGYSKMGSNYAPAMYVQNEARENGCQQVLWLSGPNEEVSEIGVMSFFAYFINDQGEHELLTPPLDGTILPSITRKSVLELSNEWNEFIVTENTLTMAQLCKLIEQKRLLELFGTGTACIICPITEILYRGQIYRFPLKDETKSLSKRFLKVILDIQYGRIPHPWAHEIPVFDSQREDCNGIDVCSLKQ